MSDDILLLCGARDDQRAAWIASQTDSGPNFLLYLHAKIQHRLNDPDEENRSRLAELYLWLIEFGRVHRWFRPDDSCLQLAYFVSGLRARGLCDGLEAVLPSADDIVGDCLDLIPITLDEVPAVVNLQAMTIEEMRRSRRTKNLVNVASWHAGFVVDRTLATRLHVWTELLPRLV